MFAWAARSLFYTQVKEFPWRAKKKEFDPDVPDPDIWYEPKAHRSLLSGPCTCRKVYGRQ